MMIVFPSNRHHNKWRDKSHLSLRHVYRMFRSFHPGFPYMQSYIKYRITHTLSRLAFKAPFAKVRISSSMMIFFVAVLFVIITFPISANDLKKNTMFMKIFDYSI